MTATPHPATLHREGYVCSSSLAISGARPEDLLPEIDGIRGLTAFLLEDVAAADRVLTF